MLGGPSAEYTVAEDDGVRLRLSDRLVGDATTVNHIRENRQKGIPRFRKMFKHPELIEEPSSIPEALDGDT